MANVVVAASLDLAGTYWQHRLTAVELLDLAYHRHTRPARARAASCSEGPTMARDRPREPLSATTNTWHPSGSSPMPGEPLIIADLARAAGPRLVVESIDAVRRKSTPLFATVLSTPATRRAITLFASSAASKTMRARCAKPFPVRHRERLSSSPLSAAVKSITAAIFDIDPVFLRITNRIACTSRSEH